MKRLSEDELRKAPDYAELKWYNGIPVIVSALGETWKRVAATEEYSPYFVVSDDDDGDDFYGTYSDAESIEPSE
ncbi:MAG: hypothetical protein EPN25_03015 [Nitrospirae bacterium]|nr:MAG: hypothetical protein EPN25_03015 [Nitrospirota bacterium]